MRNGLNVFLINENKSDSAAEIKWYRDHEVCFGTMHGHQGHMLGIASDNGKLQEGISYAKQHVRAVSGREFSSVLPSLMNVIHLLLTTYKIVHC
jgi:hypothetical protein